MTFLIPSSSTFTVPLWLVGSNGTSPDTGASEDSLRCWAATGNILFTPDLLISAISANAGQYYAVLTPSHTSKVGLLLGYHDQGAFPVPVFDAEVLEGSVATFNWSVNSVGLKAQTHSAATVGAGDLAPGTYSGVTVGINNAVGDVSSRFTTAIGALNYSGVTVRVHPMAYSGLTVGAGDIAPGAYSGVSVEILTAGIQTASFAAGAIDAAAIATDAGNEIADAFLDRNMATGTDSGSSAVRTPRNALRSLRNRVVSDATQIYVYGEDDTTIVWTASLSTVASTANHISGLDPNS